MADHPTLLAVADGLLLARRVLAGQFKKLDSRCHRAARANKDARLLTTAPGVGSIVALTFASAIDDPGRFKSSKSVGPLFGLTPRRYQSGETDLTGRISKCGDAMMRTALYEAANVILERLAGDAPLRKWGLALARKLAVILHRICGCWWMAPRSMPPRPRRRHNRRRHQPVRTLGTGGPEQGPVAGTMDQVKPQQAERRRKATALPLDWPADPYETPSGGGHRTDHGQKRDIGGRIGLEMLGRFRKDV